MLAECQVQVRDLVMGPGTPYKVLPEFNPFMRTVRATQGGPRAWNHGTWSGAEWADEVVVPIPLRVGAQGGTIATWLPLHQRLAGAFAAVGDVAEQVELRFVLGGREYVMFGRPRMVQPRTDHIAVGKAVTQCAFVALDPRIYSGELSTASVGLPIQVGGLTVPWTVPLLVGGTVLGGGIDVLNEGTADAPLLIRIDGPVSQPRVVIRRPDGVVQQIQVDVDLTAGQWLDIDTAAGTVFLNGLATASRRGQAVWDVDPYPLLPGTTEVRFGAAEHNDDALMTVTHRSAWW